MISSFWPVNYDDMRLLSSVGKMGTNPKNKQFIILKLSINFLSINLSIHSSIFSSVHL